MERYIQSLNQKVWYIFADRYAVACTDDRLSIVHDLSFHDDKAKHGCIGEAPCHLSIETLPAARVIECLADDLHIDLPMAIERVGPNLGTTAGTTIGEWSEKGERLRSIEKVQCVVTVVDGDLVLDIKLAASAVHPDKVTGALAKWERRPATYCYQPRIPAEFVGEFLNMTNQQQRRFARR